MHPDSEGSYDVEPIRCHACSTRESAARAHREAKGDMAGLYFPLSRQT